MPKNTISDRYYDFEKGRLTELRERYSAGEISDEELHRAESAFYNLETAYKRQGQKINDQYPEAAREQWLFDYLCEQVGISRQDHGLYCLPEKELERANQQIWKVIDALTSTWDKGDVYYPHPRSPELRHALVNDLMDRKRRARARRRNLSDMAHGRPFRGQGALMMDPPLRETRDRSTG